MSKKLIWGSLFALPVAMGLNSAASAQTASNADTLQQIRQYAKQGQSQSQVRSVNQLRDVKPTDWAYQALRSLVERYGCIAGYPDSTFRGNRALTRYEFAAGLNACLDKVNELIASATADLATQEDLKVLQRLQDEFQAELATLRGRVDALEARTSELEANQFSTTTKLAGEVLFSLQDEFGTPKTAPQQNTTFGSRVRLDLTSSFTGADQLFTRLEAENIPFESTYGPGGFEYGGANTANNFNLDALYYTFKPTQKSVVVVGPIGVSSSSFVPTTVWDGGSFFSDYFDSPAFYEQDADQTGIGGNYQFNKHINLAAGYLSDAGSSEETFAGTVGTGALSDGDKPSDGVFVSNWAAMTQLTGKVGKFTGALAFIHEYDSARDGGVTLYDGVGTSQTAIFGGTPGTADTVGLAARYDFSPRLRVSVFGSHTWADNKLPGSTADAKAYSAGLGFVLPDLFRKGNTGGIAVGIPPTVYGGTGVLRDTKTPIAIDLFYEYALSDHISVTPGGIILFNGNGGNPVFGSTDKTVFVGAIKTKFKF